MRLSDTTWVDDKTRLILRRLRDNWHVLDVTEEFIYRGRIWRVIMKAEYESLRMTYTVIIFKRYESFKVDNLYYNVSIKKNMELVLRSGVYPAPESATMTKGLEKNIRKIISYYEKHQVNLTSLARIDEYELEERVKLLKLRND